MVKKDPIYCKVFCYLFIIKDILQLYCFIDDRNLTPAKKLHSNSVSFFFFRCTNLQLVNSIKPYRQIDLNVSYLRKSSRLHRVTDMQLFQHWNI